ncbi:hypothetical protein [Aliikangiella coralliicola]|uniref:Uncharacterized protein n=1 Tax=Aliikangiella coralliicola TaxID=2592383 RepID=A0A545UF63_9GAMM|nr:hypothetical protein [Aliikangiella coralliicola]TQV88104.1 hypothetical protein FLL46_06140 [Aliikangiella coralliicola]
MKTVNTPKTIDTKTQPETLPSHVFTSGKNINFFKARAKKLLKIIQEADLVLDDQLRNRLYQVDHQHLLNKPEKIKRKHALHIIALENGFECWTDLKQQVELENTIDFTTFFGNPAFCGFTNHWFNNYDEAKKHQLENGGVLLPYRHHYFVTTYLFLEALGFDCGDPDWESMGFDWVNPLSQSAKKSILRKLVSRLCELN